MGLAGVRIDNVCELKHTSSSFDSKMKGSKPQLPSFAVWSSRQLCHRDLLFGTVLMMILLIYLSKTVPQMCRMDPRAFCCDVTEQQQQQQQSSVVWRLVCGCLPEPYAGLSARTLDRCTADSVPSIQSARWSITAGADMKQLASFATAHMVAIAVKLAMCAVQVCLEKGDVHLCKS